MEEGREMRENLQKMQKLLKLNCAEEKKEKLLLYFNSFLSCYLSFDGEGNILVRNVSKTTPV